MEQFCVFIVKSVLHPSLKEEQIWPTGFVGQLWVVIKMCMNLKQNNNNVHTFTVRVYHSHWKDWIKSFNRRRGNAHAHTVLHMLRTRAHTVLHMLSTRHTLNTILSRLCLCLSDSNQGDQTGESSGWTGPGPLKAFWIGPICGSIASQRRWL